MRKTVMASLLGLALAAPSGMVLAQHESGPGEVACVGARGGGRCDVAWLNYSVESRRGEDTNCARSTSTQHECYRDYTHSRDSQAAWGPNATQALVPELAAGPVTVGGVYITPPGGTSGRVWTGLRGDGVGSGSAAAGGTIDPANRTVTGCVTLFGEDETPGHLIATQTNAAQGHANDDFETDVTFCGVIGNGL